MTPSSKIFIGPPGTGKSSRLIECLEAELKSGVAPNKIAFVSFTKKAVGEVVERVCDRFNFTKDDMVYFRTAHSLAFAAMGLKREQVMHHRDYKKIGEHLGMSFSNTYSATEPMGVSGKHLGDKYSFIDGFSKARHISPKVVWDMINHDCLNWFEYLRYVDTLAEYKRKKNMYDYSDMLQCEVRPCDVDVLIIDEAQDLSTAQWYFVKKMFANTKRVYIGGDDDQAIFEWCGADVGYFIDMVGEKIVLDKSYRIPAKVHELASGITSQIKHRSQKTFSSKAETGLVDYWMTLSDIDMSSGTWLLLCRNSYLLCELAACAMTQGYNFSVRDRPSISKDNVDAIKLWERHRDGYELTEANCELLGEYTSDLKGTKIWHEAFDKMPVETLEYYVSLLRRGESLTKAPRINITTIHGSKGGEADNVVLLTDMAYATWDSSSANMDSEHRVWYVGATRAKESLHIVQPRGRYSYDI